MNIEQTDNFIASLGLEAYRVGGSVRDEIIGREPKDADYMIRGASLATVGGTLRGMLMERARLTDLILRDGQHVGYRIGRPYNIEITLPRREESTGPGHGDFEIIVDPFISLEEDAQRRDFTFNALYRAVNKLDYEGLGYYDPNHPGDVRIIDPTERGLDDLQRRIINVTHADSFRDDPLRILRALRFAARGYDLGAETQALMAVHSDAIDGLTYRHAATSHIEKKDGGYIIKKRIPGDNRKEVTVMSGTVYQEMNNILEGPAAVKALRIARDTGVLGSLFPELKPMIGFDQASKYHDLTTDEHTFKALEVAVMSEASLRVRWALLFHDSGKPESAWTDEKGNKHFYANLTSNPATCTEDHEVISARLWRQAATRMSGVEKEFARDVETLIRNHMVAYKSRGVAERTRRMRVKFGAGLTYDLLMHRACDLMGKDGSANKKHVDQIRDMVGYWNDARVRKVPTSVKELKVNGSDAIALGIDGPMIGPSLRGVLDEVAVRGDEVAMTREWQLKRLDAQF